ncbi:nitrite reductase [Nocardioides humilatus]|uniref:Nitrite reductase n=1 Tax=Nocardioides humilatus TaxID=2607660 RepID=A0A5B1LAE3_9ACTN|nr:nitrite reductase [Nocardioides humilatus]
MLRPWPADDGALVRIRVPGGQLDTASLVALTAVAAEYGDGRVRVTGRSNLQLRALPRVDATLPTEVVAAIEATGLLPSRAHDLARNVLCSPQTGRAGGLADLRPVVADLDRAICASPALAGLPGRFLFTLDDGRGDVRGRHVDLGLDALDESSARLRVGPGLADILRLDEAAGVLVELAEEFVRSRGDAPDAPWHLDEDFARQDRTDVPLPYGPVPGGDHVAVTDGIDPTTAATWAAQTSQVVITPWHGVLI